MSWIDNILTKESDLRLQRPDRAEGVRANYEIRESETDPGRHNGYTREYAFQTRFQVTTTFYANQAQYRDRQKVSERAVIELVFEPYLKRRARLMHAIMDGNEQEAVSLLNAIDQEIGL